jgi:class 3 adenylate cyclase/tetratricopeptide (TPR) repeat protein
MDTDRHHSTATHRQRQQQPPPVASGTDAPVTRAAAQGRKLQKRQTLEVAVLFTDIRGSSIFFKIHGDIAGRLMMQRHFDMLFPLIEEHRGAVVKTVGDSIMATFFDPLNAVNAAVAMQQKLFDYNTQQSADDPIRIRIGINFGKGIVEENDVFGDVVNVASKLVSLGESEQIVVSESICEALTGRSRFTVFPLRRDNRFNRDLKITAYAVRWQEGDQMAEKEMTILSLAAIARDAVPPPDFPAGAEPDDATEFFSSIEQVVREKAFRTTVDPLGKLRAVFDYAETAIDTALQLLRLFQLADRPFHMGIHTGRVLVEEVEITGGEEADATRDNAGPGEVYLTQSTYAMLKDNLLLHFLPMPASLPNGLALHKLLVESSVKSAFEETRPVMQFPANGECFYCSSSHHHTGACPSRTITCHTNGLSEMGYLSTTELRSRFAVNGPDIVRPLSPDRDIIAASLSADQSDRSGKLAFEAFYEVNEVFQLRFMRNIWYSDAADWKEVTPAGGPGGGTEFLWLGEENLRAGKYGDALIMFNKALAQAAEDYRPHTGLGFLAIEQGDLITASHQFQKALACTLTPVQRSYLLLLLARIHELKGNFDDAVDAVRQALAVAPDFLEAQYRQAVLLARKGGIAEALSLIRALVAVQPGFYPRVLIDPCLNDVQQELDTLTRELFDHARDRAEESIQSIRHNVSDHKEWFSEEDGAYKAAEKLLDQTDALLEGNGYFGLLNAVSACLDIKDKLRLALRNRRRSLRKNIALLEGIGDAYERYLDSYAYKSLLSYGDTALLKQYSDALDLVKSSSLIESADTLKETEQLIKKLFSLSKKIGANRKKLGLFKMTFFASGCFLKFFMRFVLCTLSVSVVLCFMLVGYESYAHPPVLFAGEVLTGCLRFSFFCGTLVGAGAALYWLYNNFDRLYAKLQ